MAIIGLKKRSFITVLNGLKRYCRRLWVVFLSLSLTIQPVMTQANQVVKGSQGAQLSQTQITIDPNFAANNRPTMGAAPNGMPFIDIAPANQSGLSHNKYQDFQVGRPGVVFNNHNAEVGHSQLGGIMPGNPNLKASGAAAVILNEVNGGKRSALEGPLEVFGRPADVVIANPNGITCNGCGFINTPRASLTTGIAQIGLDGQLTGFAVRGGDVTIAGAGANLMTGQGGVGIFDIVSRSVRLDAPLAGRDIGIFAGAGQFDYAKREMKELYDIAGKPEYAIDGSVLGSLQGERIKMIASEKGVGVRMRNDMAAHAGQMSLSADGKISLKNGFGRDGVAVASRNADIDAKQLSSKGHIALKASQDLKLDDIVAHGQGHASSTNGLLSVSGNVLTGGDLVLRAKGDLRYDQVMSYGQAELTSHDGAISLERATASLGDMTLKAQSLDLSQDRSGLHTPSTLKLDAHDIKLANSALTFGGLQLNSQNGIDADNTTLRAITQDGGSGTITVAAPHLKLNENSAITAGSNFAFTGQGLDNAGQLAAGDDLIIKLGEDLSNHATGLIYAGRDASILADGRVVNDAGAIIAQRHLLFANAAGQGKSQTLANKAGLIQAGDTLHIDTTTLANQADKTPTLSKTHDERHEQFAMPEKIDQLHGGLVWRWQYGWYNPSGWHRRGPTLFYDRNLQAYGAAEIRKVGEVKVFSHRKKEFFIKHKVYDSKDEAFSTLKLDDGRYYKVDNWWQHENRDNGRTDVWSYAGNNSAIDMAFNTDIEHFDNVPTKTARLAAGRNMVVNADTIHNHYSAIEAGQDATINANTINNAGLTRSQYNYTSCNAAASDCFAYHADGTRNSAGDIAQGRSGEVRVTALDDLSASIKAGANLALQAVQLNNSAADGSIAGSVSLKPGDATHHDAASPLSALNGITAGRALFKPSIDMAAPNMAIAQNLPTPQAGSGGVGGNLPAQNFIYETRSAFLDVGKFYGSAYFLKRIGYNPDRQTLFLGDAYFENQLIEQQMRDLVGQGLGQVANKGENKGANKGAFSSDNDSLAHMKTLLDRGADYSKKHGLAFGQALSPQAAAKLDKTMVVYVKQALNGRNVYAPKLYVAEKDKKAKTTAGAKLQGNTVKIRADHVEQSGLIAANTDLTLQAGDVLSKGGSFAAEHNIAVVAENKMQFDAGHSQLNNQTLLTQHQGFHAGGNVVLSAQQDLKIAGLNIQAGKSLGLTGHNVAVANAPTSSPEPTNNLASTSLQAGGDVHINAERDVTLSSSGIRAGNTVAMAANQGRLQIGSAAHHNQVGDRRQTRQTKSEIAGQTVALNAGSDAQIVGSDVRAQNDLKVNAKQGLAVMASQNMSQQQKSDKMLFRARNYDRSTTLEQQSSTLSSGGNMALNAGREIAVAASNLAAGQSLGLQAGDDINIAALANTYQEQLRSSDFQQNSTATVNVGSALRAGGNLTAIAGQPPKASAQDGQVAPASTNKQNAPQTRGHDLNITGSSLDAGEKLGVQASHDVNIVAAQDHYHQDSHGSSGDGFLRKKRSWNANSDETKVRSSQLQGNQGITIQTGNNTTIAGSNLSAGAPKPSKNSQTDNKQDQDSPTDLQKDTTSQAANKLANVQSSGNSGVESKPHLAASEDGKNAQQDQEYAPKRKIASPPVASKGEIDNRATKTAVHAAATTTNKQEHSQSTAATPTTTDHSNASVQITSGGNTVVSSMLDQKKTANSSKVRGVFSQKSQSDSRDERYNVASNLLATGDIAINSAEHVAVLGSNNFALNNVDLQGDSVSVVAGKQQIRTTASQKKTGLGAGAGQNGFASVWGKESHDQTSDDSTNIASTIAAGNGVRVKARQTDVNVVGSQLRGQNYVQLDAARDANIAAGVENHSHTNTSKTTGFGLKIDHSATGLSVGAGLQKTADKSTSTTTTHAQSQLSADSALVFNTQRDVNIQASDLKSGRDVSMQAKRDTNFLTANNTTNTQQSHKDLFAGITATVNVGALQTAQTIKNAVKNVKAIKHGENRGLNIADMVVNGTNGIFGAQGTYGALKKAVEDKSIFVNSEDTYNKAEGPSLYDSGAIASGSLTAGLSRNKQQSHSAASAPVVSTVTAGRAAHVGAEQGSITGHGVQLSAGGAKRGANTADATNATAPNKTGADNSAAAKPGESEKLGENKKPDENKKPGESEKPDESEKNEETSADSGSDAAKAGTVSLQAGKDISLSSAVASQNYDSRSRSFSLNAGVDHTLAHSFTGDAALSKNNSNGESTTHINSHINTTGAVDMQSGHDTQLKGAVVSGRSVAANVGGNLQVESQQDTAKSRSRGDSYSVGFKHKPTVSPGINGLAASWDYDKLSGDYASVVEQSGIAAGQDGFNLQVDNNTTLKGGMVGSTATAENNTLSTGTLETSDITNMSRVQATTGGLAMPEAAYKQGLYGAIKTATTNALKRVKAQDKNKNTTTKAAVGQGHVMISDDGQQRASTGDNAAQTLQTLNRDTAHAHEAAKKLDATKLGQSVARQKALRQKLSDELNKTTDSIYDAAHLKNHPLMRIKKDKNGNVIYKYKNTSRYIPKGLKDDTAGDDRKDAKGDITKQGVPESYEVTGKELENLEHTSRGPIVISANGIFNDVEGAGKHAAAHSAEHKGPSYFQYFPKADSFFGELLMPVYQGFFENNLWGMTKSGQFFKDVLDKYGKDKLALYAHSRGTITMQNAFSAAIDDHDQPFLNDPYVAFHGAAANAEGMANLVKKASGGKVTGIDSFVHNFDIVARVVGRNWPSMFTFPNGSFFLMEIYKIFRGDYSTHSCYGGVPDNCLIEYGEPQSRRVEAN